MLKKSRQLCWCSYLLLILNFTSMLKNLKADKSIHNQTILGAVLSFILMLAFMYGLVGSF